MDDVTNPNMSLPTAAQAARLDARYVRELLADHRMVLFGQSERLPRQAHRACLIDVLRLRVLFHLRDAGLSDSQALYAIDLAVDPLLGGLCGAGVPIPFGVLQARVSGAVFHVIPDDEDEQPGVYSTPSHVPAPDDAPVAITLNLGAILSDVTARLSTRNAV